MVFQFHHLFAHLTAVDNVWLAPVHVLGVEPRRRGRTRALALLDYSASGIARRCDAA